MNSKGSIGSRAYESMSLESLNDVIEDLVSSLNVYVDEDFDCEDRKCTLNHLNSLNYKLGVIVQKQMASFISLSDSYFCLTTKCANDPAFAKKTLRKVFISLKKKYEEEALSTRTPVLSPQKWIIPPAFRAPRIEIPDITAARSEQATAKARAHYHSKHYWHSRKHWTRRGALKHIEKLETAIKRYLGDAESRAENYLKCVKSIENTRYSIATKQNQLKSEEMAKIWRDSYQCYANLAHSYIIEAHTREMIQDNRNNITIPRVPTTAGYNAYSVSSLSKISDTNRELTEPVNTSSALLAGSRAIHKAKSMQLKPRNLVMHNARNSANLNFTYSNTGSMGGRQVSKENHDEALCNETSTFPYITEPCEVQYPNFGESFTNINSRILSQTSNSSSCYDESHGLNEAGTPDTPVERSLPSCIKHANSRDIFGPDSMGSLRISKSRSTANLPSNVEANPYLLPACSQVSPLRINKISG